MIEVVEFFAAGTAIEIAVALLIVGLVELTARATRS